MGIVLNYVNRLPVKTWRRLGVNGATIDVDLPDTKMFKTQKPILPEGVTKAHESILLCAEFKSAVADELATYTRVHQNAGVQIKIAKGTTVQEPIVASYKIDSENPALVDNNVVFAEANSEVTIVMIYDSDDETAGFHSGLTRVIAENCAVVKIVQVQTLNTKTRHFSDFSAVIANGASVELYRIELGAADVYSGCFMKLEGDKSESQADTFYFGDGDRILDFNYISSHLGRQTRSGMNTSGALFDNCDKIFRGTIDFITGAENAKGAESESTLIFSDDARARSAPLILCGEESVEGSHAASIGRMEEHKLYYLQSRGLSERDAKRLMVIGQMETVMKNLSLDEEKDRLRKMLDERIK